jgi:hypothetical protein
MKRFATLLVAAGALALVLVALAPDPASAGWRHGGYWGGPRVGIYVGPGWGYGYNYYRPYRYYSYGYYPYAAYPYWRGRHNWRRYGGWY